VADPLLTLSTAVTWALHPAWLDQLPSSGVWLMRSPAQFPCAEVPAELNHTAGGIIRNWEKESRGIKSSPGHLLRKL
jgi:hypothetical protein